MQVERRTSFTVLSTEIFVNDHDEIVYLLFVVVHIKMYLNSHQNSLIQSEMISQIRIQWQIDQL